MNNRLKQFLAAENITQAQFADSINVVRASVSHILSGRNNPSFDFIKGMMTHYPNLNMDWLIFGKGKMYKELQTPDSDLLFPEEQPEQLPPAKETVQIQEESETKPFSSDIKTLDNNVQHIVKQRKVSKIFVFFDDGTFQEL